MKARRARRTASFMLVLLFARPAHAELFASAKVAYCGPGGSAQGPGSASVPAVTFDCGDFEKGAGSAGASAGLLGMGTSAGLSIHDTLPTIISGASAIAIAESRDTLTAHGLPAGTLGYVAYDFDVTGTNMSVLIATFGETITHGGADAFTLVEAGSTPDTGTLAPLSGVTADLGDAGPDQVLTLGANYDHVGARITVHLLYEVPFAVTFLTQSAVSVGFDPAVAETFDGATDFGTIALTSMELQDQNHNPVPGASLSSASGTPYPLAGSRPDLIIDGQGDGTYNGTGKKQTEKVDLMPGATRTFVVTIQNDGSGTGDFTVVGSGDHGPFSVRYLKGAKGTKSITDAVESGTYTVKQVAPGASRTIRMKVKASPTATPGATAKLFVEGMSAASVRDRVKAVVRVVP